MITITIAIILTLLFILIPGKVLDRPQEPPCAHYAQCPCCPDEFAEELLLENMACFGAMTEDQLPLLLLLLSLLLVLLLLLSLFTYTFK